MAPWSCWNEVTAIFGGTFDPPISGHREAVRGAFHQPGSRDAFGSYRRPCRPTSQRSRLPITAWRWRESGFARPAQTRCPVEIKSTVESSSATGEASYYLSTPLRNYARQIPKLAFVIGADQLAKTCRRWHRFPEVLGLSLD